MGEKKPSKGHKNRKAHNWLVYKNLDKAMTSSLFTQYIGEVVYDLGAGEAPYREYIMKYAKEYVTVDWSKSMHNIQVDIVADLNKGLPIENEVCNTVISISVLEHLRAPQMMVNEAYRILKKGGTIILQVPWQWWIHEAPYDFHRYTPYGLTYLLEKAGFNGIKVSAQSGFFTMVILKFNYFTRRFVHGSLFLRTIILAVLIPFWYIGQLTAPLLDKLDRNWDLETSGYFIMAHKR